ncbi:hypothetical protein AAFO92_19940 [Roseovarius sp. CAU 1744]|uniref:hypothetical protein n=1 Tax=Roseovarius sp. CAU 1744 TaxID=3140368 RepID=UPI00325B17C4
MSENNWLNKLLKLIAFVPPISIAYAFVFEWAFFATLNANFAYTFSVSDLVRSALFFSAPVILLVVILALLAAGIRNPAPGKKYETRSRFDWLFLISGPLLLISWAYGDLPMSVAFAGGLTVLFGFLDFVISRFIEAQETFEIRVLLRISRLLCSVTIIVFFAGVVSVPITFAMSSQLGAFVAIKRDAAPEVLALNNGKSAALMLRNLERGPVVYNPNTGNVLQVPWESVAAITFLGREE